jgi:hypothetical protein
MDFSLETRQTSPILRYQKYRQSRGRDFEAALECVFSQTTKPTANAHPATK